MLVCVVAGASFLYSGAPQTAWGKGKFDPRQNIDGLSKPVVIPPAYGLQGIHGVTFTGDGNDLAYWNRYVAVAEMGGLGTVVEPRLNLNLTNGTEDRVSSKLAALQAYQLTLQAPPAPLGSFDPAAATRGPRAPAPRARTRAGTSPRAARRSSPPRAPAAARAARDPSVRRRARSRLAGANRAGGAVDRRAAGAVHLEPAGRKRRDTGLE